MPWWYFNDIWHLHSCFCTIKMAQFETILSWVTGAGNCRQSLRRNKKATRFDNGRSTVGEIIGDPPKVLTVGPWKVTETQYGKGRFLTTSFQRRAVKYFRGANAILVNFGMVSILMILEVGQLFFLRKRKGFRIEHPCFGKHPCFFCSGVCLIALLLGVLSWLKALAASHCWWPCSRLLSLLLGRFIWFVSLETHWNYLWRSVDAIPQCHNCSRQVHQRNAEREVVHKIMREL